MDLGISGLASGFDWKSFISQMLDVERAPEKALRTEQSKLQQRNSAYSSIKSQLSALQTTLDTLKDPTLFDSRSTSVSDDTVGTASATAGAVQGSYTIAVTQLATAASMQGGSNVGKSLSSSNVVSGVILKDAGFSTGITAGSFTLNGQQVTVDTSESLQQLFDRIKTATTNSVTGSYVQASYEASSDKITLSSRNSDGSANDNPIILGSPGDTSNFLQVARLNFNNGGVVTSASALGSIKLAATLTQANFANTISDGGSGAGQFKINGVAINFNASTDTVATVMARINDSAAGVIASYDSANDRFNLTNKATGDSGIALEDVTGNFLAATQLSGGSLQRGKNLVYSVNGGGSLTSASNTITEASSGLTGLSVTVYKENASTLVQVTSNTEKIRTAIADFVAAYNKVQSLIDTQTASSTDASGKVTAGILAAESDANEITSHLRSLANLPISGLTGTLKQLEALGYASNGNNNTMALSDSSRLDDALTNNLVGLKSFFTDETNGLAVKFNQYLDATIGDNGTLVSRQNSLTSQSSGIDKQVADMERLILADQDRMTSSFVAMEQAQQQTNQQLQFLQKQFAS
jgi:flagellar hook-associated protein 2